MTKGIRAVVLLLTFVCASVSGVFAFWQYSHLAPNIADGGITSGIKVFDYPPEEIVPGDDQSSSVGENHLLLINEIVYEASYGLNATKKPIIHNYLKNPGDVIYCSQNVQGGNLKHLMIDGVSEADKLYFVITKISDSEYHAFTMRYADITNNSVGTEIEAYKTVMLKDDAGEWAAKISYYGAIKVNAPGIVSRGVDVDSWRTINK